MTRAPWKPGPDAGWEGPVYVSVTDFAVDRARDLPAVWTAGLRLRHAWPRMQGAVGLWLWAIPTQRRGGSVSVWRSEEDLMRFVRSPVHVAIVRANRDKGSLRSESWESLRFAARGLGTGLRSAATTSVTMLTAVPDLRPTLAGAEPVELAKLWFGPFILSDLAAPV